jgi:hypothetical protein
MSNIVEVFSAYGSGASEAIAATTETAVGVSPPNASEVEEESSTMQ